MTVHKLTDHPLPCETHERVVEAIQSLLDRAKRGEISGLAWAGCVPNGDIFEGWEASDHTALTLGAGVVVLQARYVTMIQGSEASD